jgi:hypothetical protein
MRRNVFFLARRTTSSENPESEQFENTVPKLFSPVHFASIWIFLAASSLGAGMVLSSTPSL